MAIETKPETGGAEDLEPLFVLLPPIFRDCAHANGRLPTRDGKPVHVDRPWAVGGFAYATDGRICVRMPVSGALAAALAPAAGLLFPDPSEVFDGMDVADAPTPIPPEAEGAPCEWCVGGLCRCGCGSVHACRACGGRVVRVLDAGPTGGGNPTWRCADCGIRSSGSGPKCICFCGLRHEGQEADAYLCIPRLAAESDASMQTALRMANHINAIPCHWLKTEITVIRRSDYERAREKAERKDNV